MCCIPYVFETDHILKKLISLKANNSSFSIFNYKIVSYFLPSMKNQRTLDECWKRNSRGICIRQVL